MRFPSSPLSRRNKNPSTISRSRSLASSAEGRMVVEGGSQVSKAAWSRVGGMGRARSPTGRGEAGTQTLGYAIRVEGLLTIGTGPGAGTRAAMLSSAGFRLTFRLPPMRRLKPGLAGDGARPAGPGAEAAARVDGFGSTRRQRALAGGAKSPITEPADS